MHRPPPRPGGSSHLHCAGNPGAGSQVRAAVAGKPNWHVVDWTDRCGSLAHFDDPDGVAQLIESHTATAFRTPGQSESRGSPCNSHLRPPMPAARARTRFSLRSASLWLLVVSSQRP